MASSHISRDLLPRRRNKMTPSVPSIIVSNFPNIEIWQGCPVSSIVVASAIHRTYGVRTNEGRITFEGRSCIVELQSEAEKNKVLSMAHEGVYPTLHHKDTRIPDWSLSISPGNERSRFCVAIPRSKEVTGRSIMQTHVQSNGSVLQLSGFNEQSANEIVVASIMHRTFNIKTNPVLIWFAGDRKSCWIDLEDRNVARHVMTKYDMGVLPILQQNTALRTGDYRRHQLVISWPMKGACLARSPIAENNEISSLPIEHSAEQDAPRKLIQLTGLPGNHAAWRFLNGSVLASILFRTFGVETKAERVMISDDRRSALVSLTESDAHVVLTTRLAVVLHHRDQRILSLRMAVRAYPDESDDNGNSGICECAIEESATQPNQRDEEWQRLIEKGVLEQAGKLHPSWEEDQSSVPPEILFGDKKHEASLNATLALIAASQF